MIARIWKGAVRKRDGNAYADYMHKTGVAGYANTPGNCGVWMLRREVGDHTEFLMFTLWDSLDSVTAFAGEDYETAVFYPEDDRFLVERDEISTHYVVDTYVLPPANDESEGPGQVVREHVRAFNARDLDDLLGCFSADATWVTGSDRFRGTAELANLFEHAFTELRLELTIQQMVIERNWVACQLREQLVVDGMTRADHIAGFYRVREGRIEEAKIYREGSADA